MTVINSSKLEGLCYISVWITCSSVVIIFNKRILDEFPYAITLTTWHMLFATMATQILARTTDLISTTTSMDTRLYLTTILPIGMCFSMSLILSNAVYLYLSMTFIQVLKALGPVATLLACWSMGIRKPEPSLRVLFIVCVIVVGVMISSFAELKFVAVGFLMQIVAVLFEAYKNALQQALLGGKMKMSSLTLLYYFAPACTVINVLSIPFFEPKVFQNFARSNINLWIILMNGFATFGLNIASVTVIKKTSSVALTISGIPKAILLSLVDMIAYSTPWTQMQVIGFAIAGFGTYRYSTLNSGNQQAKNVDEEKMLARHEFSEKDHLVNGDKRRKPKAQAELVYA